ncbi:Uncharacterised protein [Mycobacterium tuberculosis]|nr:Uncharacterised protein [Mycobacterium tuberculosis]
MTHTAARCKVTRYTGHTLASRSHKKCRLARTDHDRPMRSR